MARTVLTMVEHSVGRLSFTDQPICYGRADHCSQADLYPVPQQLIDAPNQLGSDKDISYSYYPQHLVGQDIGFDSIFGHRVWKFFAEAYSEYAEANNYFWLGFTTSSDFQYRIRSLNQHHMHRNRRPSSMGEKLSCRVCGILWSTGC